MFAAVALRKSSAVYVVSVPSNDRRDGCRCTEAPNKAISLVSFFIKPVEGVSLDAACKYCGVGAFVVS